MRKLDLRFDVDVALRFFFLLILFNNVLFS